MAKASCLKTNLIRGVGPVMAERIVNKFGEETLAVIEETPERLSEVLGIGKKRIKGIEDTATTANSLKEEFKAITRIKSQAWNDVRKKKKLEKIMAEVRQILESD